jgi:hypothetical protein
MAFITAPGTMTRYRRYSSAAWKYKAPAGRTRGFRRFPITRSQVGGALIKYGPKVAKFVRGRRRRRESLYKKIPVGVGSTTSYWTSGKNMTRANAMLWKNNQTFFVSGLSNIKMLNTAYGAQVVALSKSLTNTDFVDDCTRLDSTLTTQQKTSTSLLYGTLTETMLMTNQELTTVYVDIYEVEPRFHQTSAQTPITMWYQGLQNEESAASTVYSYLYPGEKPFRSKMFCYFYKITKVIRVELGAGQSHRHISKYKINKIIHGEIANSFTTTRDFTKYKLMVASGSPVNDSTNNTLVSTSSVTLDIVVQKQWEVTKPANYRQQSISFNTLSTITSAKVVTDSAILTDGSA